MTDSYYILQGGEKTGPYTFDEITDQGLEVDTKVVSSTGSSWQNAADLPDFNEYFQAKGHYFPTEDNLATFWWRLLAYIIDYTVLILIITVFSLVFGFYLLKNKTGFDAKDPQTELLLQCTGLSLYILYNSIFEATPMRGSIGKKLCNIAVVDADGRRLSFIKALLRNAGKLLSSLVFCIGFLNILWDEHRQGWHDQIAKTYVIRQQA